MRDSNETLAAFRDRLIIARSRLLKQEPFLGFLALELPTRVIESVEHHLQTAATDGKCYYFNYHWCRRLTDSELVFVVAHEIAHVIFLHGARREGRDSRLWNAACDFAVNSMLVVSARPEGKLAGIASMPVEFDEATGRSRPIGLCEARFAEQPAEVIYEQLVKEGRDVGENWDQLLEPSTEAERTGNMRQASAAIAKALIRAKELRQRRGRGDEPGFWERWAEKEIQGSVRWQDRFRQRALAWGNDILSWSRPNPRCRSQGIYLPRYRGFQMPDILFAFDTSASISDEFLGRMIGELNSLLISARNSLVRVVCCDADVHVIGDFTSGRRLDPRVHSVRGGGGTDFRPVFDYLRMHNNFRHLIFLTDACGTFPEPSPSGLSTLWLVPDLEGISVPFGDVIVLPINP